MRRGLRIAAVVMALSFVCAAALAQPNAAPKKGGKPDAGAPLKHNYLMPTKAPPMDFRHEEPAPPAPPATQAPVQQAPQAPAQKK
ncbi:MAG: hypothetical protein Q8N26_38245 [Myxococcales bacterium]|nr:hypothetical protein [Myxococcales bacterium]